MAKKTSYVVTPEIAAALRNAREQQKKSQSRVAHDLNVSQTTIQKLENGATKLSSCARELWMYYELPLERFEHLQQVPAPAQIREATAFKQLTPSAIVRREPNHVIQQLADTDDEEMSTAALGELIRRVTRERVVRVVDGRVGKALRGSQAVREIAIAFTRANGSDVKVILSTELAQALALEILRMHNQGDDEQR